MEDSELAKFLSLGIVYFKVIKWRWPMYTMGVAWGQCIFNVAALNPMSVSTQQSAGSLCRTPRSTDMPSVLIMFYGTVFAHRPDCIILELRHTLPNLLSFTSLCIGNTQMSYTLNRTEKIYIYIYMDWRRKEGRKRGRGRGRRGKG